MTDTSSSTTPSDNLAVMINLVMSGPRHGPDKSVFFDHNGTALPVPRQLGETLHQQGGMSAMCQFILELEAALERRGCKETYERLRELEFCWVGIGHWQA